MVVRVPGRNAHTTKPVSNAPQTRPRHRPLGPDRTKHMTSHLTMDFERFNPDAQDPGTKQVYILNVASLPGGDMLRLAVLVAKGAEPGPTLVAFGGVHGDEYEGPHAAKTVYRGLDPAQLSGTFIAVPQCNVPGLRNRHEDQPDRRSKPGADLPWRRRRDRHGEDRLEPCRARHHPSEFLDRSSQLRRR